MSVKVSLNRYELMQAAVAGVQRRISSIEKDRPQRYGADKRHNEWQIDIVGMMGEYAVAKYLNIHWQPATDAPLASLPGDVGRYQVRSSQHGNAHLFVHESDDGEVPFILAVIYERSVLLQGWIWGKEKQVLSVKFENNTYWIPQASLRSMDSLPIL